MNSNWNQHYDKVTEKKLPPSGTLTKALTLFEEGQLVNKHAIDLGCGSGIDTIELLRRGWEVTSVDKQSEAIDHLRERIAPFSNTCLTLLHASFECIELPSVQLVNASFSLPFCSPQHFEGLWKRITKAIVPGGRFAGQFFGINDTWADNDTMNFHSKEQVHELFDSFSIESFEEIETEGKTILGKEKHWHVFHVVAQKESI